jgi:Ala-tRNA(Pro) deacylase
MLTSRLREFLDERHARYETIPHSHTATAQETAESAHVPGKEFAKSVMVKLDDRMIMTVLPADVQIDLDRVKQLTGSVHAELAGETEFGTLFPGCEIGAMPPFGNLYGLEVFVDAEMAEDEMIAFNAGTHEELVRMSYEEYEKLVKPVRANLAI